MKDFLKDYSVLHEQEVSWGDMDAFQHVNNTVYFRYFENARVTYGQKIAITDRMATEGIGPILAWVECRFIKPVTYPDTLSVGIRVSSVQGSEMMMEYTVVSRKLKALVAKGRSLGMLYDYRNRKRVDFSDEMIGSIETLEGAPVPRKHASVPGI